MATSQVVHVCVTQFTDKNNSYFYFANFSPSSHADLIVLPALTEERNRHM